MMTEVDYFEYLENVYDDGLPLDEDTHLYDYDYDELTARIESKKAEDDYVAYLISTGEI